MPIVIATSKNIDQNPADHQTDRVRQRIALNQRPARPRVGRLPLLCGIDDDSGAALLEARDITKSFAGTKALVGAELDAARRPDPCAARRQRRRQVDTVAGHLRPRAPRRAARSVSRRAARSQIAARGARRRHRDGDAGDEPRARSVGRWKISSCRSSAGPGGFPAAAMRRRASEILAELGQEQSLPLDAEVRRSLRGAAATRRDRQGAGAQRQSDHLRRADRVLEPQRGRAPVRRHRRG